MPELTTTHLMATPESSPTHLPWATLCRCRPYVHNPKPESTSSLSQGLWIWLLDTGLYIKFPPELLSMNTTFDTHAYLHEDSEAKESSPLFLDGDRCECNGCRHSGRGGHVARTQKQVREYKGSWRTNQGFFYLGESATLMEMERTKRKLRVWVVE